MNNPDIDTADSPLPAEKEYQDPHFHDEDTEIPFDDDGFQPGRSLPARKRTNRRPPPRRQYLDD